MHSFQNFATEPISLWSANDPKKMEKMIGIIFNAKKASETFITQQTGKPTTIFLEVLLQSFLISLF